MLRLLEQYPYDSQERIEAEKTKWIVRQLLEDLITSKTPPFCSEGVVWICEKAMGSSDIEVIYLKVINQSGDQVPAYIRKTLRLLLGELMNEVDIKIYNNSNDFPGQTNLMLNFYLESTFNLKKQLEQKKREAKN